MNTVSPEEAVVELIDDEHERGSAEIMTGWPAELLGSWADRTPETD